MIRAFSLFALLANVAEDLHRERRRAMHVQAGDPSPDGSLAAAFRKLADAGLDGAEVAQRLTDATVVPVVTAHPTETRRRTVFDAQNIIKNTMRTRERMTLSEAEEREALRTIKIQILTLWQTALIWLQRVKIQDEIEVGLRFFSTSLFEVMPQINARVREQLRELYPDQDLLPEPLLRAGSWIGGDRDGNPLVDPEVVTKASARVAGGHYPLPGRARGTGDGPVAVGTHGSGDRGAAGSGGRSTSPTHGRMSPIAAPSGGLGGG